jgi:hypothetical protein
MQNGLCDGAGNCQLYANGTVCVAASCNSTSNNIVESLCDGNGMCKAQNPFGCAPFKCAASGTRLHHDLHHRG